MSLYDYEMSKQLAADDPPFNALIMAAMRKADSTNAARLAANWPLLEQELRHRYWSSGGLLPGEEGYSPAHDDYHRTVQQKPYSST